MRPNHTCDSCIRKKRKCDRLKPSCTLCRLSGIECNYKTYTKPATTRQTLENKVASAQPASTMSNNKRHELLSTEKPALAHQEALFSSQLPITSDAALLQHLQETSIDAAISMATTSTHMNLANPHFGYSTSNQHSFHSLNFRPSTSAHNTVSSFDGIPKNLLTASSTDHQAVLAISDTFYTYVRPHLVFSSEAYLRKILPTSNFAICAVNALCALWSHTAQGMALAKALHKEAISHLGEVLRNPKPADALGMSLLSLCTGRISTNNEINHYLAMSIRISKDMNLSTEEGIDALASSESEKDDLRCIWWSVYQFNHFISSSCNMDMLINDEDCLLQLPSDKSISQQLPHDLDNQMDIAVMSLSGWYTPPIENRGLLANLLIIQRIHSKISQFSVQSRNGTLSGVARVQAHMQLEASLLAWYKALPKSIQTDAAFQDGNPPEHSVDGWRPIVLQAMYHAARINLWRNLFADNVLEFSASESTNSKSHSTYQVRSKQRRQPHALMTESKAIRESIQAAQTFASDLVKPMLRYNASSCISPFFVHGIFSSAVCLVTALKLPFRLEETTQIASSLGTLMSGLQSVSRFWRFGYFELDVIEQLATFPNAAAIAALFGDLQFPKILRQKGHHALRAMKETEYCSAYRIDPRDSFDTGINTCTIESLSPGDDASGGGGVGSCGASSTSYNTGSSTDSPNHRLSSTLPVQTDIYATTYTAASDSFASTDVVPTSSEGEFMAAMAMASGIMSKNAFSELVTQPTLQQLMHFKPHMAQDPTQHTAHNPIPPMHSCQNLAQQSNSDHTEFFQLDSQVFPSAPECLMPLDDLFLFQ
ncbi:hypothetical protein BDV3_003429 [Batrachochytrium dendrobatidis]